MLFKTTYFLFVFLFSIHLVLSITNYEFTFVKIPEEHNFYFILKSIPHAHRICVKNMKIFSRVLRCFSLQFIAILKIIEEKKLVQLQTATSILVENLFVFIGGFIFSHFALHRLNYTQQNILFVVIIVLGNFNSTMFIYTL